MEALESDQCILIILIPLFEYLYGLFFSDKITWFCLI
jgi:hypothetical protein